MATDAEGRLGTGEQFGEIGKVRVMAVHARFVVAHGAMLDNRPFRKRRLHRMAV